jgi:hypothetical protein
VVPGQVEDQGTCLTNVSNDSGIKVVSAIEPISA